MERFLVGLGLALVIVLGSPATVAAGVPVLWNPDAHITPTRVHAR